MRKGCRPDKKAFEFQFGILKRMTSNRRHLTKYDLEILNPTIFTSNLNFMEQNGLVIEYIIQVCYILLIKFNNKFFRLIHYAH